MDQGNNYLNLIKVVLLVFVVYFIARFIYQNLPEILNINLNFKIGLLIISIINIWIWLTISAVGFHLIMHKISPSTRLYQNLSIWSYSYIGLYIPGKIGVLAFRILEYNKQGISALKVSYGLFIEMILSLISSVIVIFLGILITDLSLIKKYLPLIIVLFILLIIIIHPRLIELYAKIFFKYFKKDSGFYITKFDYFFYLKIIILQLLKWCAAGLGIFFLINSVTHLSWNYLAYITGLYASAAIIGMIAFFAPSGLGVVEGVMIVGLKTILSNALAGIISILIRLWKIVGELSFIFLVMLLLKGISNAKITNADSIKSK